MGCNLCTILRSDGHHKLLPGMHQVNGRSLFQATHDHAVEAFQTAEEPIEIRILRRKPHKTLVPVMSVDSSTQTKITLKYLKHIEAMVELPSPSLPLGMAVLDTYLIPTDCHMTRQDSPSQPDFFVGTREAIESRGFEYEIHPDGVTVKNGRIQERDQIIQINGVDIQSHEGESKNVTLLAARPQNQGNCSLEDRNHLVDDLRIHMSKHQHHQAMEFTARMLKESRHEDDGGTTDTTTIRSNLHEKDSGVGRTDDSTRNDESSEQDILGDDLTSVCDTLPGKHKKCNYGRDTMESRDTHLSHDSSLFVDDGDGGSFLDSPGMVCKHFRELLELKCTANGSNPCGRLEPDAKLYGENVSLDSEELDVQMLNEELQKIELECLRIIQAHSLQTGEGEPSSNDSGTKHLTSVEKVHQDGKQEDKESSSAYNTGESGWSIPPPHELSPDFQSMVTKDKGIHCPAHGRNSSKPCPKHPLSPIQETSSKSHSPQGNPEVLNVAKTLQNVKKNTGKCQSLYIPAHAQHFKSYMHLIQQKSAVEYAQSQISLANICKNSTPCFSRTKMEWKVKIHSNGTRYISKRPTRDQLLKERASRIREERCSLTTDDDAASELKLGRYWNREERKQHIVHAKEQRQRRELIKQGRFELGGTREDKKAPDIIQLSHKKMTRKRNKRILDNWMTIQELLTHGTRSTDGTRLYNSFLSVTTV